VENYQLSEEFRDGVQVAQLQLGYAEKLFRGGRVWGVGCRVLPVLRTFGEAQSSRGQLPNFQGKSAYIFPPITASSGTF